MCLTIDNSNNKTITSNTSISCIFMITLMLLVGCKGETPSPFQDSDEAIAYDNYMADYNSPKYKWGYIDDQGALSITNKYDDCRDFSEGLAAVNLDGLWTYIDKTGTTIMKPRYRAAQIYSEGIGIVQTMAGGFLLYDKSGKVISDTLWYDNVDNYHDGRAKVKLGSSYGYINPTGTPLDSMPYLGAKAFRNGLAIVQTVRGPLLIDTSYRPVMPDINNLQRLYYPSSGIVRVKTDDGYRYYHLGKQSYIGGTYARGTDFDKAHAVVHDGTSYQLLHKSGKTKRLPYEKVAVGGEGYWIYRQSGKYGYLENDGTLLTLANHTTATRYRSGMAAVESGELWGYIDGSGKLVINYQYPLAWDYVHDRARMISQEGYGFINKTGDYIIPPYYIEVRDFSEGLARVQIYRQ